MGMSGAEQGRLVGRVRRRDAHPSGLCMAGSGPVAVFGGGTRNRRGGERVLWVMTGHEGRVPRQDHGVSHAGAELGRGRGAQKTHKVRGPAAAGDAGQPN